MQFAFPGQNSVTIRTMLAHKSGQWIANDLSALIAMPEPKDVGGGISYLRRYALKAITGVAADDEDAQAEQTVQRSTAPKPAERRSQQQPQATAPGPLNAPAAPAAVVASPPAPSPSPAADRPRTVGVIKSIVDARTGPGVGVILDNGAKAQTVNAELVKALRRHHENGARVELVCHANPKEGLAPVIDEIVEQRAATE
jgi:hypothetical protein